MQPSQLPAECTSNRKSSPVRPSPEKSKSPHAVHPCTRPLTYAPVTIDALSAIPIFGKTPLTNDPEVAPSVRQTGLPATSTEPSENPTSQALVANLRVAHIQDRMPADAVRIVFRARQRESDLDRATDIQGV